MSERSGKVLLGMILLVVGALLLLDLLGIDTGDLVEILIPGAIMLYGGKRLIQADSTGKRAWGAFVFVFGLLMLIDKLDLLFSCLLAITAIYVGFRLMRRRQAPCHHVPDIIERHWANSVLKEDNLDRWERELRARKQQS
jgi:lia operon protein LiaI